MSTNTSKRLSDKAKPWVTKALAEHGNGETVTWELGITVFPDPSVTVPSSDGNSTDPSAEYALLPALVLFLELPTSDPTRTIYAAPVLPAFTLTEANVNLGVKLTLEDMRKTRSDQEQAAKDAEPNSDLLDLDKL